MQKWTFCWKKAICESGENVQLCWGHKAMHKEGFPLVLYAMYASGAKKKSTV